MKNTTLFAVLAIVPVLSSCTSFGGEGTQISRSVGACAADAVHSRHSVVTTDGRLNYDACAGTLTVRGPGGDAMADLFYTAYFADRGANGEGGERPLAFVWNGGPGADSRLLHFSAMGPRIVEDGVLIDNPDTPLRSADLVFLDPAGTGFSRASSQEAANALYGTVGDIDATARFIAQFRRTYAQENAPLYLIGESFGTWRASGTAEALADAGTKVAGIGLISGGIPLGEEPDQALSRALSLPNRTAAALMLNRLDPELQAQGQAAVDAAADWARTVWYPALADPSSLSAEQRMQVAADLARYHGMELSQIDTETLWVSPRDFRSGLIPSRMLDVFDMRRVRQGQGAFIAGDDADDNAIIAYYRNGLHYRAGTYAGIEAPAIPVGEGWQYDQSPITERSLARAMAGEGPPSPSQPWTLRAMQKMPAMRTHVAAGLYDSLNSCLANEARVSTLPPGVRDRIALHCYPGGHMMYDTPAIRKVFNANLESFLTDAP